MNNPDILLYLIPVMAVLFVVLIGSALLASGEKGGSRYKNRLNRVAGKAIMNATGSSGMNMRKSQQDSSINLVDTVIKKVLPNPELMRLRLSRTGRKITIGQYFLTIFALTALAFVVSFYIFSLSLPLCAAGSIGLGFGLPHIVTGMMGKKRQNRFLDLFPDSIDLMCRGLKSGLPITESLATIAKEVPDPIGIEFKRVVDSVKLGSSLTDALQDVARRLDLPEFNFLITAISIQKETGGNLVETLYGLSDLLRKRRQMKKKIVALTSEGKASAWLLGVMPLIMLAAIKFLNPVYANRLFDDPKGHNILMMGGAALFMAVMWIRQLIKFEI